MNEHISEAHSGSFQTSKIKLSENAKSCPIVFAKRSSNLLSVKCHNLFMKPVS